MSHRQRGAALAQQTAALAQWAAALAQWAAWPEAARLHNHGGMELFRSLRVLCAPIRAGRYPPHS